jgi:hypothetical protein
MKAKERYWKLGGREKAKRYEAMRRGKPRSMDKMVEGGSKTVDKQACEDGEASGSLECSECFSMII